MNKLKTLLPLCYLAIAEIGVGASLDDVFISLYNEMNTTNTTQSAFMSAVTGDRFCWFNHYRAARGNIPDEVLSDWYTNMVAAVVPDYVARAGTNCWLGVKQYAITDMAVDTAISCSTNCWFAVAREHGLVRSSLRSAQDLDALRGINQCQREVLADGVVVVSVPGLFSEEQALRDSLVTSMKEEQSWREDVAAALRCALRTFAKSTTFTHQSPPEHNSIVSNLVNAALLNAEESALLGLTNIVDGVAQ